MNSPLTVMKIGGSEGVDLEAVCTDIATHVADRRRLVVVHGGSHAANELGERLGFPARFITSPSGHTSRRTDRATLEIFQMACRGVMNQRIVALLLRLGVNALGLSGIDGRLWVGARKSAVRSVEDGRVVLIRDDYTGVVETVNAALLTTLLDAGYVPVISPPAISTEGEPINVDADRAASRTAAALGANELLLLTNVPGVLRDREDESTLIPHIARNAIESIAPLARGRMKTKLIGASEALDGGVRRVVIGDARVASPVSRAFAGAGTVLE